jgi:hypothetical protein
MRFPPVSYPGILLLLVCLVPSPSQGDDKVDFVRDIRPILSDTCFACHGPDEHARKADLRLDRKDDAFADRGGYHLIVPGKPLESELYLRISDPLPDQRMPPRRATRKLSQAQIDLVQRWIEQGADWQEHWAFVPPERPPVPGVRQSGWPDNPIDNFVLARLEREGLSPSPEVDRARLLRRVTLDLTGIPPTLAEIDAFVADTSADAYERVVDRLLASPRYGEHLARPWLDASRYADTDGYQNDRLRYMWVWRDWLIRALNANLPYDQFLTEQLAGDLLPGATFTQQVATGFCRNHRINSEAGSIPAEFLVENVVDRVDTLGTVFLGLTVGCARCHDHKYDPITQKEYYQLYAFFNNVPEWGLGPNNGNSPPFLPVPSSWPNLSPEENHFVVPKPYTLTKTQGAVLRPNPGGPHTVMVMHELDKPRPTYLLKRGAYDKPDRSEVLRPDTPSVLGIMPAGFPRNRLGLAQWLTNQQHPLTARVAVNRYWQHFFGRGLVETSENFGVQGKPPTHPQLLDWLATEFVRLGWDVKALHKLIVTSATYRQSSRTTTAALQHDPENRLLSHAPRKRLSAHVLRDSALAVSGLLVEEVGGPSVKPYMPPGIWKSISNARYQQDHGKKLYRRSLYTYWRRTVPPPTMLTFNAAERETCIVRKDTTTTPLQALTLMNNVAFVEAARCFAERLLHEASSDDERILLGFRLATSRRPTPQEHAVLREALSTFRAEFRGNPARAEKLLLIGEKPRDTNLDRLELASYTLLANTILNLDEVITRD